ncbi:nucleotidyl transferase AbiEii/AbiGii toxin family protein [Klenkia sp. PcliD-1-E]|uniref:nucleotidyl transferase AbiEii/AbiGii toxin family protein n=1 Tax=Klenkia sp. PcliD-1-E TaxID=2954492 RepID=UPI00209789F6|nr:nucleotidyl transferase AbiEii/AbiGii toxin family protein [Klenkia sp. PcliD-1-E]MCO7218936.1 nucleotidyl transferase AbiEii/AbiGii toxin family protein [Klenkia sp. PcliD-1-E]
MFDRPHHRLVAEVLSRLDADVLTGHRCWFGGGTAIALSCGEYRESVDIDFLVSDQRSYRALRQAVKADGLSVLATGDLDLVRPARVDNHGIRAAVRSGGVPIKFEVVLEGRIELDEPPPQQAICGIRTLTRVDQVASKLLANDDRWADRSTFSRDLVDLAMMAPKTTELVAGAEKAVGAYGRSVGASLRSAVEQLRERPQRLDECMRALAMRAPRAVLWQSIRDVASRCAGIEVMA